MRIRDSVHRSARADGQRVSRRKKEGRNLALIAHSSALRGFESRGRTSAAEAEVLGALSKAFLSSLSMTVEPEDLLSDG